MLTALQVPEYVGYFTVGVPVNQTGDGYGTRAVEIVERYLYFGEVTGDAVLSDDDKTFLVPVRVESARSHADLDRSITANRDRLSSGLYASTAPVYLMRIGPSD